MGRWKGWWKALPETVSVWLRASARELEGWAFQTSSQIRDPQKASKPSQQPLYCDRYFLGEKASPEQKPRWALGTSGFSAQWPIINFRCRWPTVVFQTAGKEALTRGCDTRKIARITWRVWGGGVVDYIYYFLFAFCGSLFFLLFWNYLKLYIYFLLNQLGHEHYQKNFQKLETTQMTADR